MDAGFCDMLELIFSLFKRREGIVGCNLGLRRQYFLWGSLLDLEIVKCSVEYGVGKMMISLDTWDTYQSLPKDYNMLI